MIPAPPSSEAAPFSSLLRNHYPDSGNNLSPQNLMANYHPLKSLVVENNFNSPEKELLKGSSIPIVCPFETNLKELADNFHNMDHLNNKYQSKELKQINQQCPKTSLTPQDFTDNHMPNVMSTPALTLYSKQKDKQEMYFINQYSNKKLDNKRLCSQINVVQSESNLVKNERNNKNNDVTQKKLEYDFDQKVYDSKLGVTYYKGKLLGK
ncbi:hypothetical protein HELRODRAFT_184647, partial [Helobdella robusta]|uniref:Uncharacterized protein n=1 Tax=Helobdella robusta TaxID=6412 RepID=T1FLN7_HELRO